MEKKDEKYTKTELKELGFTDRLIKNLLPEPEKGRSSYSTSSYSLLWSKVDVDAAMKDERYLAWMAKKEERVEKNRKNMEKKANNTMAAIQEIINNMKLPERISIDDLRKSALDWQKKYVDDKGVMNECYYDPYTADEDTVKRWMVNFVRHNMTQYNFEMFWTEQSTKGHVGKWEAFIAFEEAVYKNIIKVYPELADECDKQFKLKKEWAEQQIEYRKYMR